MLLTVSGGSGHPEHGSHPGHGVHPEAERSNTPERPVHAGSPALPEHGVHPECPGDLERAANQEHLANPERPEPARPTEPARHTADSGPADPPEYETRRGGLWWHLDFRRLWIGDAASQVGVMVTQLALPLLAVQVLRASAFEVGLLTACQTVAFLLIGLPAGAWVDRMRHRTVLIVNDLIRAVALGSLPIGAAFDLLTLGHLYAVALTVGVCTVFFDVAYQSFLPGLVGRDHLVEANAKLQGTQSVARVAGPGLGGYLVQALTAPYAVLASALTLLWSASWVGRIRTRPPRPERRPDAHLGREVAEGVRFVFGHPLLRAIATTTAASNLCNGMIMAVEVVLLARLLDLPAGTIGLLFSVGAVGGIVGALYARRIAARLGQGPTIWMSILVSAPLGYAIPFVQADWTLGWFALYLVVHGGAGLVYNVTQVSFRQALCPPHLLGRMNATIRFLVWGTIPVGGLLGGALGSAIGIRETLLVAAVGATLAFLPAFLSPLRRMRELPTTVDGPNAGAQPTPDNQSGSS